MSAAPKRSAPLPPPPPDEHEEEEEDGASANERLLAAAKNDNESLLESALEKLKDINGVDGLGNTALHYAILHASTNVLETILCHETCDVDLRNRLAGDTPLHIAVRQRWEEAPGLRRYLGRRGLERSMLIVVESLLEAGADTKIRNRHNQKPIDLLPPYHPSSDAESDDEQVRSALRRAEAEAMVADAGDVANDSDGEVDPDDIASD